MTDNTPSRHDELERLRVTLLEAIAGAGARDLAPLARELRQVLAELELTVVPADLTVADQIAARRQVRRADVAARPSAARRSQPRRSGGSNQAGGRRAR